MQLSDTQSAVLAAANARGDRMVFPVSLPLKGGAIGNVLKSLLRRGLLEEIHTDDQGVVWRCDDDGRSMTLRATALAGNMLGRGVVDACNRHLTVVDAMPTEVIEVGRQRGFVWEALVALLGRPEGATIAEMQDVTGWLPHSVRGALSGVVAKKLGHKMGSMKEGERGRVYRITRELNH